MARALLAGFIGNSRAEMIFGISTMLLSALPERSTVRPAGPGCKRGEGARVEAFNYQLCPAAKFCSVPLNLGKPLGCVIVAPADSGFPGGRRLLRNVTGNADEIAGVVRQHQVEIGDVNMRLVPIDQSNTIRRHTDVAGVGRVSVHSTTQV